MFTRCLQFLNIQVANYRSKPTAKDMDLFIILVGVLLLLAVFDLLVGVANDAVNFLNSAIGSKVATLRTILIIASIGVLMGAIFSGGMMEVARKGIFNPVYFSFADIMIIFLAVMFTDIILLDLFNTYGLPTSTTVSIVFEILGASIMVGIFKSWQLSGGFDLLGQYIQSERAMTIIISIFLSVAIAFTCGLLVQSIVRLWASKFKGVSHEGLSILWAAVSMTGMVYFLFFKGFKAVSWISEDFIQWIQASLWLCLAGIFFTFSLVLLGLRRWLKVNPLKIVVLTGTFGLAMAFASNDLVNFIGPAITAMGAYQFWSASGTPADSFLMTDLAGQAAVSPWILVISGIIMILALWFSKKARTVTETEVGLGRQNGGKEKFKINLPGRLLVTGFLQLAALTKYLPSSWQPQNSPTNRIKSESPDAPAFDLFRASVNLTVASVLIASATSLKLPLSTTYVTFMVAMGTSLADRAWGRDNAVYRVSGVIYVIGGWFLTALAALAGAAIVAALLVNLGVIVGLAIVIVLAVVVYAWTYRLYRRRTARDTQRHAQSALIRDAFNDTTHSVITHLQKGKAALYLLIKGLTLENKNLLNDAASQIRQLKNSNLEFKHDFYQYLSYYEENQHKARHYYLLIYDLQQDFIQSLHLIYEQVYNHVVNGFAPLHEEQNDKLKNLTKEVMQYFIICTNMIHQEDGHSSQRLKGNKNKILLTIEQLIEMQTNGISSGKYSQANSNLMFTLILEIKDLLSVTNRLTKLYQRRQNEVLLFSPKNSIPPDKEKETAKNN